MFIKTNPLKYFIFLIICIVLFCGVIFLALIFILNRDFIEVSGEVKPFQYQVVKTKISGILKKKYFKDGDLVKKGDLLIEINISEYKNKQVLLETEQETMKNKIENQKTNLALKQKKTDIIKYKNKLEIRDLKYKNKNNIITKKELNKQITNFRIQEIDLDTELLNLKNNLNQLEKDLKAIETEILNLNEILQKSKIYSQLDGLIVEEDNMIKEDQIYDTGDIVQYVYSDKDMYVEVFIPERKIIKVELNQDVKLFFNAIPYTKYKLFNGKLVNLKKTTLSLYDMKSLNNKNSNYYIGKVKIDDPYFKIKNIKELKQKRILFGLTLNARIYTGKKNLLKKFLNLD